MAEVRLARPRASAEAENFMLILVLDGEEDRSGSWVMTVVRAVEMVAERGWSW